MSADLREYQGAPRRFEVTGARAGEHGQALLTVIRRDGPVLASGLISLDQRGELVEVAAVLNPGGGPSTIDGELLVVAREAARAAGLIPPVPHPERELTDKPRILTIQDGHDDDDANGEGCIVVVDDPVSMIATGKYGGPKEAPPNRDFIHDLAGLPGRKYLVVTDANGKPIQPPRSLDGRSAVFHGKDGDDERLSLSSDFATIYRSWQDAEDAIREARARGVLP